MRLAKQSLLVRKLDSTSLSRSKKKKKKKKKKEEHIIRVFNKVLKRLVKLPHNIPNLEVYMFSTRIFSVRWTVKKKNTKKYFSSSYIFAHSFRISTFLFEK